MVKRRNMIVEKKMKRRKSMRKAIVERTGRPGN